MQLVTVLQYSQATDCQVVKSELQGVNDSVN
jgi:hypothetical protein